MRFCKGHGTGNDFVILPDPDAALDLTGGLVAAICDRRTGIGADGVLRVVPTAAEPEVAAQVSGARWFMDYRNADGSVAEMCGNGVRVFARYLVESGLMQAGEFAVATRAGLRTVALADDGAGGEVTVDMGAPRLEGTAVATIGGRAMHGVRVDVGNPHLACLTTDPLRGFDLGVPPEVSAELFPRGVNVELLRDLGARTLQMRVHERGSGETLSCGTGVVAAAAAAADAAGEPTGRWRVEVPGGTLTVDLDGRTALLRGPAVLVADGEIRPAALGAAAAVR